MRELGHKQAESTLIWEDNKAVILIAEIECSSAERSKDIDVRYKFVAQAITEGSVRVRYTPTDMNLADVLTRRCLWLHSRGWLGVLKAKEENTTSN
jgi:hypothetical protein